MTNSVNISCEGGGGVAANISSEGGGGAALSSRSGKCVQSKVMLKFGSQFTCL